MTTFDLLCVVRKEIWSVFLINIELCCPSVDMYISQGQSPCAASVS